MNSYQSKVLLGSLIFILLIPLVNAHEINLLLEFNSTETIYFNNTYYSGDVIKTAMSKFASILYTNDIFSLIAYEVLRSTIERVDSITRFSFTSSNGKFRLQLSNTSIEEIKNKIDVFITFSNSKLSRTFLILTTTLDIVNNLHISKGIHELIFSRTGNKLRIGEVS